ncbi:hypothetical protein LR48_Vigan03g131900 [Vigna angularis]|uniref:Uncharacterized protein n=1 Tax=Phaseolus angularis TaxID=3914 RepID=A0A0L9U5I3_PHAAN|nr:hypothetical protein LR48_Vigan03g131900 [Vigna angularis]
MYLINDIPASPNDSSALASQRDYCNSLASLEKDVKSVTCGKLGHKIGVSQSSSLDASYEDILVQVRENEYASRGGGVAPMDDLEVPPIVDNDEGPRGEDIDENEDHVEDKDDYPAFDMKDFDIKDFLG